MVGIVIVSHSKKMAEGLLELIRQMVGKSVAIELAAGTSDGRLGTDAFMIEDKIRKASSGDGVLVIVDIGSAVMSAEMAIENLEESLRKKVKILDVPFIEGAIVACMEASFGKNIEDIISEAEKVRDMKKIN